MREINKIIIHCTATKEGVEVTAAEVDRWHKKAGYNKIGYHFLILLNGEVQKGRGIAEIGAHTKGYNTNSIGICYVGGLDSNGKAKDTRTEAQKITLKELITRLKAEYPKATIHGHREFANKACPCFDVKEYESK